ncbi:type II secretion system protein N [Kordiimonas laminariae]|uniref:type II secretion system protein N n=1 Tax=Kordiimonas laminariae TaxID=2917717 RepID=UPI001FF1DE88|nr:type II secretion system protein N [Kordiimonas laminariae]MCK0068972.1 hypothetical protein [Kordiimonas laminariae]
MPKIIENVSSSGMAEETNIAALSAATPKWLRVTATFVEVLLVIFLGYFASQLFTKLLSDTNTNVGSALPPVITQPANRATDYSSLTRFDPFFRQLTSAPTAQAAAVRESSLKIKLYGLRAEGEGEGNAIVQMEGAQQKLVRTGESISNGIQLVGVYSDRIEIARRGAREAVYMFKTNKTRSVTTAPQKQITEPNTASSNSHIITALTAMNWEPVRENNRIIGFRLTSDVSGLSVGLEKGDIIQSVNGFKLNSFENLKELPDELSGASKFTIELLRRGERRTETIG